MNPIHEYLGLISFRIDLFDLVEGRTWITVVLNGLPWKATEKYIQTSEKCRLSLTHYCCSVPKLCLTLCIPVDCRKSDSPVLHYLPEIAQFHVH